MLMQRILGEKRLNLDPRFHGDRGGDIDFKLFEVFDRKGAKGYYFYSNSGWFCGRMALGRDNRDDGGRLN